MLQHPRCGSCREAARADVVFDGQRHARERTVVFVRIDLSGAVERALGRDVQERAERSIGGCDPIERRLAHLHGGDLSGGNGVANFSRRLERPRAHPMTRGTLNKPV